jgi:predicted transcriptional regulator
LSKYAYLLITKEKWWNRRLAQHLAGRDVQVFVRKNASGPIDAKLLLFYISQPTGEVRGIADFKERFVGKIEESWSDYGKETVFESHNEYIDFMQGRTKATFIRFSNLRELSSPIPLKKMLEVIGISWLPRGGKYLSQEVVNKLL